jgi:hypothetical protein
VTGGDAGMQRYMASNSGKAKAAAAAAAGGAGSATTGDDKTPAPPEGADGQESGSSSDSDGGASRGSGTMDQLAEATTHIAQRSRSAKAKLKEVSRPGSAKAATGKPATKPAGKMASSGDAELRALLGSDSSSSSSESESDSSAEQRRRRQAQKRRRTSAAGASTSARGGSTGKAGSAAPSNGTSKSRLQPSPSPPPPPPSSLLALSSTGSARSGGRDHTPTAGRAAARAARAMSTAKTEEDRELQRALAASLSAEAAASGRGGGDDSRSVGSSTSASDGGGGGGGSSEGEDGGARPGQKRRRPGRNASSGGTRKKPLRETTSAPAAAARIASPTAVRGNASTTAVRGGSSGGGGGGAGGAGSGSSSPAPRRRVRGGVGGSGRSSNGSVEAAADGSDGVSAFTSPAPGSHKPPVLLPVTPAPPLELITPHKPGPSGGVDGGLDGLLSDAGAGAGAGAGSHEGDAATAAGDGGAPALSSASPHVAEGAAAKVVPWGSLMNLHVDPIGMSRPLTDEEAAAIAAAAAAAPAADADGDTPNGGAPLAEVEDTAALQLRDELLAVPRQLTNGVVCMMAAPHQSFEGLYVVPPRVHPTPHSLDAAAPLAADDHGSGDAPGSDEELPGGADGGAADAAPAPSRSSSFLRHPRRGSDAGAVGGGASGGFLMSPSRSLTRKHAQDRRTHIRVGPGYQAVVPPAPESDHAPDAAYRDQLVWDPSQWETVQAQALADSASAATAAPPVSAEGGGKPPAAAATAPAPALAPAPATAAAPPPLEATQPAVPALTQTQPTATQPAAAPSSDQLPGGEATLSTRKLWLAAAVPLHRMSVARQARIETAFRKGSLPVFLHIPQPRRPDASLVQDRPLDDICGLHIFAACGYNAATAAAVVSTLQQELLEALRDLSMAAHTELRFLHVPPYDASNPALLASSAPPPLAAAGAATVAQPGGGGAAPAARAAPLVPFLPTTPALHAELWQRCLADVQLQWSPWHGVAFEIAVELHGKEVGAVHKQMLALLAVMGRRLTFPELQGEGDVDSRIAGATQVTSPGAWRRCLLSHAERVTVSDVIGFYFRYWKQGDEYRDWRERQRMRDVCAVAKAVREAIRSQSEASEAAVAEWHAREGAVVKLNADMDKDDLAALDWEFHDSECQICDKGGELLCCSACDAAFHSHCLPPAFLPPPSTVLAAGASTASTATASGGGGGGSKVDDEPWYCHVCTYRFPTADAKAAVRRAEGAPAHP